MTKEKQQQQTEKGISFSPKERAKRITLLRKMTNLSRDAFCRDSNINPNTLAGWEHAKYGGLTEKGALKIIERATQEGVICTMEWLMNGTGILPMLLPDDSSVKKSGIPTDITQEIILLKLIHANITYTSIVEDALLPHFELGDVVAGIKLYATDIKNAMHHVCIVKTSSDDVLVRMLKPGSEPETYDLISTNLQTTTKQPTISNMTLIYAAPVIRHLKPATILPT